MNQRQRDWLSDRATRLEGWRAQVPLSREERVAIDSIVGDATLIGLGEATHGSKEAVEARERILRFLIEERNFLVVVMESCFAATRQLNEHLVTGASTPIDSLVKLEYWSCVNTETLGFVKWLREHNASRKAYVEPVRVYGCDVQSIDGAKAELSRLLKQFQSGGQLPAEECRQTTEALEELPTDRVLYAHLAALVKEASSENPNQRKVAKIQARQSVYMTGARTLADKVTGRLRELLTALPASVSNEDRFFFERCIRLVEQVFDFYSPGGLELRDRYLAENVLAVKTYFEGRRVALALHNLHLSRSPLSIRGAPFVPAGSLLSKELNGDYKVIGSAFHHGKFLASAGQEDAHEEVVVAHTPRPTSFEYYLQLFAEARGTPNLLLDLRPRDSSDGDFPWPDDLEMRIGEAGSQGDYEQSFCVQQPVLQYDALIFLIETSPITILPEYYDRSRLKWGPGRGN